MFLDLPDTPDLYRFQNWVFTSATLKNGEGYGNPPDDLQLLKATVWPPAVKDSLAQMYAKVGIDALDHKLVEPQAKIFGGFSNEGEDDFSDVNWNMVLDYFQWELAMMQGDAKESDKLQGLAMAKYGFQFSHYRVYDPEG